MRWSGSNCCSCSGPAPPNLPQTFPGHQREFSGRLLVSPDMLFPGWMLQRQLHQMESTGRRDFFRIPVPNDPAAVGLVLHTQAIEFSYDLCGPTLISPSARMSFRLGQ